MIARPGQWTAVPATIRPSGAIGFSFGTTKNHFFIAQLLVVSNGV
jgi:hypothetical protein